MSHMSAKISPMNLALAQAAQWLQASLVASDAHQAGERRVLRVHTDSRSLLPGDLFVALKGETFDATAFIADAAAAGAVGVMCEASGEILARQSGLPALIVPNAREALGRLAQAWRAQWTWPVIAVTGSNGKTTVTQMIAAILRAHAGDATWATQGNFNNDIGVPLTLLQLRPHHRLAVIEMGMNHPGEIGQLADWVRPTVALVNNAQREHQEFMGTVEAVALENGSVLSYLPHDGVAVIPADDAFTSLWQGLAAGRRECRFAWQDAEVTASIVTWQGSCWQFTLRTPEGTAPVHLHIAGRHNVRNALAASACALAAGVSLTSVVQGLESFEPVRGRSRALSLDGGRQTLIDDTYNANPDSVLAAIEVLRELPGPRALVLGDMGEVGHQGPQFHAEVGQAAQAAGIEHLWTFGELTRHAAAAHARARHFEAMSELLVALPELKSACTSLLVKGSRSMKMERVVQALQEQESSQGALHAA